MKLARVLANDGLKPTASALPAVVDPAASSSTRAQSHNPACCNASERSDAAASTSRDDHWSCGVCYEEVCCPFTLPCGHTVCGSCLQQLLQFHARCPFCRLSVFQGCTFGRNVAMWNAIKARYPTEAAQLASHSTVIAFQLPSPSKHSAQQHSNRAQYADSVHNPRGSSTERLSDAAHASAYPGAWQHQPSTEGHSVPGLGVNWSTLLQLDVSLQEDQATATSSTGSANSSADGPLHRRSASSRFGFVHDVLVAGSPQAEAGSVVPHSNLQTPFVTQPEVLRRAQASFADLRRIVQNALTLTENANTPSSEQAAPEDHSTLQGPPTAVLAGINQVGAALWSRLAATA